VSELPSYSPHPNTPIIEVGPTGGIAIASPEVATDVFAVHGAFAVPAERAGSFHGHLLRAAVLLLRGPYPATWSVGTGELLFSDDLVEDGSLVRGYFNLDLFEIFNLMTEPNMYRLSVSIFENVSNIVTVEVRPERAATA
jgi:hypothetical protein